MIPASRLSVYILIILLLGSCQTIKDISRQLSNLKQLEFEIDGVDDVELSSIKIGPNFNLTDLSTSDVISLTKKAVSKKLPISFQLNIKAINPNPGEGSKVDMSASITDFPFEFYLDGNKAFEGNINSPISVPEDGGTTIIPLQISFDLFKIFDNGSYKKFALIAGNLAGFETEKVELKVIADPTVKTQIGNISPGKITIMKEKI